MEVDAAADGGDAEGEIELVEEEAEAVAGHGGRGPGTISRPLVSGST
jgi:hypothetical protein